MIQKILIVSGLLVSFSASATGGFSCEYNQDGVEMQLSGVTSHSFQGEIVDAAAELKGTVVSNGKKINLARKFKRDDVRQYWNRGSEFRIVLYAEEDNGTTLSSDTIVITTKSKDDVDFTGTMSIDHSDGVGEGWSLAKTPITCSVE